MHRKIFISILPANKKVFFHWMNVRWRNKCLMEMEMEMETNMRPIAPVLLSRFYDPLIWGRNRWWLRRPMPKTDRKFVQFFSRNCGKKWLKKWLKKVRSEMHFLMQQIMCYYYISFDANQLEGFVKVVLMKIF